MVDDTHLSRWVERDGRLDNAHRYLERFRHLIPEGGTVIDCGTSIGDHTVNYASWVGPNGRVLGFEANPDVAECCALNLAIYPCATIYNVGLSDDYGVAGINVSPNVGASNLIPEGNQVRLEPLDAYLPNLTRCDFIKVDVEGFEVRVLVGARKLLEKYNPPILMEINQGCLKNQGFTQSDVFDRLNAWGYKWKVVDGKAGSSLYDILATSKL